MIYAIADLHLDATGRKDMSVFGANWKNYEARLFSRWHRVVRAEDTVLIPGDISWAMRMAQARADLDRIEALPGRKILMRGNHDYWWQSLSKLKAMGYKTLCFFQNDAIVVEGVRIVGTRGWANPSENASKSEDERLFARELTRLSLSLSKPTPTCARTVAMLHYPPFGADRRLNRIGERLVEAGVSQCIYGHLHGDGLKHAVEGEHEGVYFRCVAADHIGFEPQRIDCGEASSEKG